MAHHFHEQERVAVVPTILIAKLVATGKVKDIAILHTRVPEVHPCLRRHNQAVVFDTDESCSHLLERELFADHLLNWVRGANLLQIDTHKTCLHAISKRTRASKARLSDKFSCRESEGCDTL